MSNLFVELKTPVTGTYKQPIGLFINNEFVEGVDKKTFEVINPTTEEVICSVHEATEKDVDIAVAAARKAFKGEWRKTTPADRGRLLNKLADLAEKNTDILAAVESLDNGKSITLAKGDVAGVVGCLRYYAGWADKVEGKTIDIDPEMFHYTRSEPVSYKIFLKPLHSYRITNKITTDWRLWSNHPLEFPSSHASMEDRTSPRNG